MDHVAGPLHVLLPGKEGRIWFRIICLKRYQFKRMTWWCLSVLGSGLQSALKYVMLGKILAKSHGLREFALGPPLEGGPDENSGRP